MFETWENLGEHYTDDKRVVIAEMNCKPKKDKKVCRSFGVDRFPTYVLFDEGVKKKLMSGKKRLKDLVNCVDDLIEENAMFRDDF